MRNALALAAAASALAALSAHRPAGVCGREALRAWPYRARGALHVHTGRSHDGRGTRDAVVDAARRAGLGFVVITDHNADTWHELEGWSGGVLVLAGQEKSTDAGHALVLGVPELPFRLDGDPATVVADVARFGGFVVAAHPGSSRPESRWRGGLEGVAGIETLSFAEPEAWRPSGPGSALLPLRYALDPVGSMLSALRPGPEALALWDAALAERPIAGLLGSDAHGGLRAGPLWLAAPSHRRVFELGSQHLLLRGPLQGRLEADRRLVLEALRAGNGYAALDALADASGFMFEARSGEAGAVMGDSLELRGTAQLRASADAPAGTTLILLRNGRPVARGPAIGYLTSEPGVYRVEARLALELEPQSGPPWIVSNAISLFGPEELLAREQRARRPPPGDWAGPVQATETIDAFEGPGLRESWQVDRSASEARARWEGGALRFDFVLGPGPRTHAAVCDWRERSMEGFHQLLFRVRAARPLRFDVQVREAVAGGGVRIWRRSVRAEPEWREAVVALDGLRTYERAGGGPDLRHVRGIYFHVDESNLRPGSSGTLWIDDLRLAR